MSVISEFMTQHHKYCDDLFIKAESIVDKEQWDEATNTWAMCVSEIEKHFQREEQVLFPEFETITGMTQGPTQMMRIEHQQIRDLMGELVKACKKNNKVNFLGLSETLMVTMQQHNMKEEQILYPMIDNAIATKDEIIDKMTAQDEVVNV